MSDDERVPSATVETFLASLKRCLAEPEFMVRFYTTFMDSSEEVREKFRGTDLRRQARVLADSLYVLAVAAQGQEHSPARQELPRLARRHARQDLDIRPELYDLWLDCLVATARAHDASFTPETEAAWRATLGSGIAAMRAGY
jgi:hemoglobin-like flavoprotein